MTMRNNRLNSIGCNLLRGSLYIFLFLVFRSCLLNYTQQGHRITDDDVIHSEYSALDDDSPISRLNDGSSESFIYQMFGCSSFFVKASTDADPKSDEDPIINMDPKPDDLETSTIPPDQQEDEDDAEDPEGDAMDDLFGNLFASVLTGGAKGQDGAPLDLSKIMSGEGGAPDLAALSDMFGGSLGDMDPAQMQAMLQSFMNPQPGGGPDDLDPSTILEDKSGGEDADVDEANSEGGEQATTVTSTESEHDATEESISAQPEVTTEAAAALKTETEATRTDSPPVITESTTVPTPKISKEKLRELMNKYHSAGVTMDDLDRLSEKMAGRKLSDMDKIQVEAMLKKLMVQAKVDDLQPMENNKQAEANHTGAGEKSNDTGSASEQAPSSHAAAADEPEAAEPLARKKQPKADKKLSTRQRVEKMMKELGAGSVSDLDSLSEMLGGRKMSEAELVQIELMLENFKNQQAQAGGGKVVDESNVLEDKSEGKEAASKKTDSNSGSDEEKHEQPDTTTTTEATTRSIKDEL